MNEYKVRIIKSILRLFLLDKAEIIVKAGINAQKQFAKDDFKWFNRRRKAYVHRCV